MGKILSIFKQEFKNAPIWQKLILIGLIAFIFYYFTVRPTLNVSRQALVDLDARRDNIYREVQSARYLMEDAKIISENYKNIRDELAVNVYFLQGFEKYVRNLFVQNSKEMYIIDFPEAKRTDYDGIQQVKVQVKLKIKPEQLKKIITSLSAVKYANINYLEYKGDTLLLEADFLVNQNYRLTKKAVTAKPNYRKIRASAKRPDFKINGFMSLENSYKVLINNKIFNIGEKCQGYTIISIDPNAKKVVLQKDGKRLVLTKYFRKG